MDIEVAPMSSSPERLTFCLGVHPSRLVEIDACTGVDVGRVAAAAHAFLRKSWHFELGAARALSLGAGGGVGGRVMRYCPQAACALAGGPELLLSIEGVFWVAQGWGLTLQLDGGVAALPTQQALGVSVWSLRYPFRALVGVAL